MMIRLCVLLILLPVTIGCENLMRSSAGSSASSASVGLISASSNSSAASSNANAQKASRQAYVGDIQSVTFVGVQSGSSAEQVFAQVARIAANYGLLNWRTDLDTCDAIGKGLRQAGQDPVAAKAFATQVNNDKCTHLIMVGYHS